MRRPLVLVHGGAGRCAPGTEEEMLRGCQAAAEAGWRCLGEGLSALDAVEAAVTALEDNPVFNAGTGAVLHSAGGVQLDASIMSGHDRRAGAVAAVQHVRNPVRLARQVLEDGRHVLMVGAGAEALAREWGTPLIDNAELIDERQRDRWEREHGTVGAVAVDGAGRLAAATSTGGRWGALPGRVGDSPLIGCGTYADDRVAVSCTGIGEAIIRSVLARAVAERRAAGQAADAAAQGAIAELEALTGAEAGVIVIDGSGHATEAHNAPHMPTCLIGTDGRPRCSLS